VPQTWPSVHWILQSSR